MPDLSINPMCLDQLFSILGAHCVHSGALKDPEAQPSVLFYNLPGDSLGIQKLRNTEIARRCSTNV